MATVIGSLVVEMSANVARLQSDMAEAKEHVNKASEEIVRATEMAKGALEALGIGFGLMEFKEFVANSIEAAARLNELSKKSSISVENLNGLQYAASQTGADFENMTKGVKKLTEYLGDAQINGGKSAEMLKALGITSKDPMEAMYQLADAMKTIPDAGQRAYVAQQLLGKGGADMVPMLLEGGDAIKQLVEEGNKLNPVTSSMGEQANELGDKLAKMAFSSKGMATQFTKGLLPALNDIIDAFSDFSEKGDDAQKVGEFLGNALKGLTIVAGALVMMLKDDIAGLMAFEESIIAVAHGDFATLPKIWGDLTDKVKENAQTFADTTNAIVMGSAKQVEATKEDANAKRDLSGVIGDLNKQYLTLEQRIQQQTDIYHASSQSQDKISETQKLRIEITNQLAHGTLTLSAAEKQHIDLMLVRMGMEEAAAKKQEEHNKAVIEANKVIAQANLAAADSIAQMQFEASLWGRSTDEIQRLTAMRAIDTKAQKEILALKLNEAINKDTLAMEQATAAILARSEAEKKAAVDTLKYKQALAGLGLDGGTSEDMQYAEKLKQLDAYHKIAGLKENEYATLSENITRQHEANLTRLGRDGQLTRSQFESAHLKTQIGIVAGILQDATGQAAQHNRVMFEINKQASAANAIISTYEGINKALAMGPWGMGLAAVIGAAGFMNVASIESAEFGGTASGSAAVGGGASSGAIPGQTANPNAVGVVPTQAVAAQANREVNIYLPKATSPADMYSAQTVRDHIIPAINDAAGDGVTINVR